VKPGPAHNVVEFKADVRHFLRSCQRRPAKVARYFRERHVTYAAAATFDTQG